MDRRALLALPALLLARKRTKEQEEQHYPEYGEVVPPEYVKALQEWKIDYDIWKYKYGHLLHAEDITVG